MAKNGKSIVFVNDANEDQKLAIDNDSCYFTGGKKVEEIMQLKRFQVNSFDKKIEINIQVSAEQF